MVITEVSHHPSDSHRKPAQIQLHVLLIVVTLLASTLLLLFAVSDSDSGTDVFEAPL